MATESSDTINNKRLKHRVEDVEQQPQQNIAYNKKHLNSLHSFSTSNKLKSTNGLEMLHIK